MRLIPTVLAATMAITATSAAAQSYSAENRVNVTPVGNGLFSVPSAGTFGARGAWCAAADYAQDALGAPGTTRIYVRAAKTGNSGPVTFGLTPGDTTPQSVFSTSASLSAPGSNLSVDHAYQFCADARLISRD